jgi:hypothetical protein
VGKVALQFLNERFLQGMNVAHVHDAAYSHSGRRVAQDSDGCGIDFGELDSKMVRECFSNARSTNLIGANQKKMGRWDFVGPVGVDELL